MDYDRKKYLSAAETAKLVREALKECYPGVKFSVRSSTYSMGASIDVCWTDGPSQAEIDALVSPYQGADFDGMQDLKTHRPGVWLKGERLSFGADYVHTRREYSAAAYRRALDYLRTFADWPAEADNVEIAEHPDGTAYIKCTEYLRVAGDNIHTSAWRYLQPLNLSSVPANGNGSASGTTPRPTEGIAVVEIAPGLHHVTGDTFPKRATLKAAGGSWDKINKAWVFVGDLPAEVVALSTAESPQAETKAEEGDAGEPAQGDPVVAKLEKLIASFDKEIAEKETPRDWNMTARRAAMDASRDHDARRLRKLRRIVRALIDQRNADNFPPELKGLSTRAALEALLQHETLPMFLQCPEDTKRLIKAGLTTHSAITSARYWIEHLDDVLSSSATDAEKAAQDSGGQVAALAQADREAEQAAEMRRKEREILLRPIPGFFPTPAEVVSKMLEKAELKEGMRVLEPSAGRGDIADKAAEVVGKDKVDVCEIHSGLRDILSSKGYRLAGGGDFLWAGGGWYDRVIMNPPFEDMQDVDHVMRAYYMLKPGGRLVAIMSESPFFREDHKALMFRAWLEDVEGWDEKLPDGSFKDAPKATGVATRIVVIDRAEL